MFYNCSLKVCVTESPAWNGLLEAELLVVADFGVLGLFVAHAASKGSVVVGPRAAPQGLVPPLGCCLLAIGISVLTVVDFCE